MKTIYSAVILLITVPFLLVGIYEFYESYAELKTFSNAVGTVKGNSYLTTTTDGVVSGAYHPNVEFTDQSGKKIVFTDGIGSLLADYEIGAEVEVVYDPQNPQSTRLYSRKRFWLAPSIFVAVGIFTAISFFIMRKIGL